jgi:hypothetical protein
MTYQPMPTQIEGGQKEARVSDADTINLLEQILLQLKLINMHLTAISNLQITIGDVE